MCCAIEGRFTIQWRFVCLSYIYSVTLLSRWGDDRDEMERIAAARLNGGCTSTSHPPKKTRRRRRRRAMMHESPIWATLAIVCVA